MKDAELYNADIFLVGLGIFELRQLTLETLDILRRARQVFHLSSKHQDLLSVNPNTEDLGWLYWKPGRDLDIYLELAKYVVSKASMASPTVFAVEGNPMIFNDISWEIVKLGKRAGLKVQALPGISCIDILPIQLGFDFGDLGVQIFEATQLVLFQLDMNPYLSTLILQVGRFGMSEFFSIHKSQPGRFLPLVRHLSKFFPRDHAVVFIESKSTRTERNAILATEIASIDREEARISAGMTLYVPRIGTPQSVEEIANSFDPPK